MKFNAMEGNTQPDSPSAPGRSAAGIKSWAPDDRPREKLLIKGVAALSNAELLAILIRSGNKQSSALRLAQQLLTTVNQDLAALSRLSVKDMRKINGLGEVKAITIIAALELGRRRQAFAPFEKPCIRSSKDAANVLRPMLADYRHEVFAVLFLSQSNRVIYHKIVSSGGLTGTIADPKVIFREALEHDTVKLVLCHNHPSGELKPSREDIRLTQKISDAAGLLDMKVLDHLIISAKGYYSFADGGLL